MNKYPTPPNPVDHPSYYSFEFDLDAYVGTMLYALHNISQSTLSPTSRRRQVEAKRLLHGIDAEDEPVSYAEINSALPRGRFGVLRTNAAGYPSIDRKRCRPVEYCAAHLDYLLKDMDAVSRVRELLYQARTIEITYRHYWGG